MNVLVSKKSPEECRTALKEAFGTINIRGRVGRIRKGSRCKFRASNYLYTRLRHMSIVRVSCVGTIESASYGSKIVVKYRYGAPLWSLLLLFIFYFLLFASKTSDILWPAFLALFGSAIVFISWLLSALGDTGEGVKQELTQFLEYVL